MWVTKKKFRITIIEDILGSWPADRDLYTHYVAAKAPNDLLKADETDAFPDRAEGCGQTVFPQDETGYYLMDYHIKGFMKEAGNVLKDQLQITGMRAKLDNLAFIKPRRIYFHRMNGDLVTEYDDIKERSLRCNTAQGPRTSLAASELIKAPVYLEFELWLLDNDKDVDWEGLFWLLEYGQLKGLGQWRNGGWGAFEFKDITPPEMVEEQQAEQDKWAQVKAERKSAVAAKKPPKRVTKREAEKVKEAEEAEAVKNAPVVATPVDDGGKPKGRSRKAKSGSAA